MKSGLGYSKRSDSTHAAIEAVENALEESGEPSLTFLFNKGFYDQKFFLISFKINNVNTRMWEFT